MPDRDHDVKADYRTITIKTLDGSTLQGKVNLTERQRVSDLFTQSEAPFIVMVNVVHKEGQGKTLIVNKKNILSGSNRRLSRPLRIYFTF